jgi:hypothetical protein
MAEWVAVLVSILALAVSVSSHRSAADYERNEKAREGTISELRSLMHEARGVTDWLVNMKTPSDCSKNGQHGGNNEMVAILQRGLSPAEASRFSRRFRKSYHRLRIASIAVKRELPNAHAFNNPGSWKPSFPHEEWKSAYESFDAALKEAHSLPLPFLWSLRRRLVSRELVKVEREMGFVERT